MKKYLKMLPLMFYPYAYLIPLIMIFVAPSLGSDEDFIVEFIFGYAMILHVLVFIVAIYNSVVTAIGKYDLIQATKINMITKCVQIPAYLFHFGLVLIGLLMSVWGIGIILFVAAVDLLTIIFTGIASIGCSYLMAKKKALTPNMAVLMGLGSFIYCIDVIIAIAYFIVARTKNIIVPEDNGIGCSHLKYPILLVHGMGFKDRKILNYWGRIPATLEAHGYKVYYGHQDANASVEANAKILKEQIEKICLEDKVEKFNVIAHSKGGLDMRYAISKLGMGSKIASLSTINTPHHGSITLDKLLKIPQWILKIGCKCTDIWLKICGDQQPNTYQIIHSFKTSDAAQFNEEVLDDEAVYYQSYAFVMGKHFSDIVMWFPHLVVKHYEGENDGFLTPEAVKWGNFRGIYKGPTKRGISHLDEIDFRRNCFSNKKPKNDYEVSDICYFYLTLVKELADVHGF